MFEVKSAKLTYVVARKSKTNQSKDLISDLTNTYEKTEYFALRDRLEPIKNNTVLGIYPGIIIETVVEDDSELEFTREYVIGGSFKIDYSTKTIKTPDITFKMSNKVFLEFLASVDSNEVKNIQALTAPTGISNGIDGHFTYHHNKAVATLYRK